MKRYINFTKWCAILSFMIFYSTAGYCLSTDGATCHGSFINPITDIDWDGIFPITVGSNDLAGGDLPDTSNPGNPICVCQGNPLPEPGLALGYWEPMALVDVTRTPYCLVNLGGQQIQNSIGEGDVDTQSPDQNSSFYYVHYYNFPVISLFSSSLIGGSCQTDGSLFFPAYFSELDPTWKDENLAAIAFPETQLFANIGTAFAANIACAADSLAANTGLPSDTAFWCAGSQGFMYPMTGEVAEYESGVQASTLISEGIIYKLHQIGLITDTDANHLCSEFTNYNMPKSRYRYQMIYPEKSNAEPFGRTTMIWGADKENFFVGDDAGYVIFRKRNCCEY